MASNPLTSVGGRSSLEHADVGASREDLAFSPNDQGSERGLLCRRHGASQVFHERLAEQVQGGFASVSIPRAPEVSKRTCLSITASYPLTARGDPQTEPGLARSTATD